MIDWKALGLKKPRKQSFSNHDQIRDYRDYASAVINSTNTSAILTSIVINVSVSNSSGPVVQLDRAQASEA